MSAHDLAEDEAIHHVPYRTYINVWLILMGLTAVTVGAALLDLKQMAVFTAILIATIKSTLVVLYFMHVRFENRLFTYMIVATFGTYAIFLILTFADYGFRLGYGGL